MSLRFGKDDVFDADEFDRALTGADDKLALFRNALRNGREALKQHYLENPRHASQLVVLYAWLIDALLVRAWKTYLPLAPAKIPLALVAVGGYGRGELHPFSDVDILLLLKRGDGSKIATLAEPFLRLLWDMGLEIGHSVRSLADCAREAKKDVTIATNLMETRLLAGDARLFAKMRKATGPKKLWPTRKFFEAKHDEQCARHARFDDTAYNLEPNIKEGPGGLRDLQTVAWVTQRHFGTQQLRELVEHDFLSDHEYRALVRGRDFLWQVRAGLHHLAARKEERLLFDHQRALAKLFGFQDEKGVLAVEQFMKRYYRTIKELSLLNEILLQHFEEEFLQTGRTRIVPINRRFQSHNGFLEVRNSKVFERYPFALLELFQTMQTRPDLKGVRANTIRLVRANLHRINASFRKHIACRSLFMEILRGASGITHELRRMNAYGVLGRYLPAFRRVVGQMQHDLFHVYTVDQHTLFVVRNIRRFAIAKHNHEFPLLSSIFNSLVKPERLYLGGLFHDIAKGRGGDHSILGEEEAEAFCRLHDMSDYDTRLVCWLVRHHLAMSNTAQREDIFDAEVVRRFAQLVGDKERLDNLYLLTVADMRGTSPKVWNVWKGRLLSMLYHATLRELRRGIGKPIDLEARVHDLHDEVVQQLTEKGVSTETIERHWARMDTDYILRHDADSLAWHAEVIIGAPDSASPRVAVRHHAEAGGTEIMVYTPDRKGLFVDMTAGIERLNLSIWDARIHTTRYNYALDTFIVLDHANQPIVDGRELERVQQAMQEQMQAPRPGRDRHHAHLSRALKHFPIETTVSFGIAPNGQSMVMEVVAQDRPGLLYQVALALATCEVRLVTAKVATFGERAEDIFFIVTPDGKPVADPATQESLKKEIVERLDLNVEQPQARAIEI